MDLSGKAGFAKANSALPKEFRGKKIGKAIFFPNFSTAVAAEAAASEKCNNLI
ncbi:MAG: hypothetical protein R2825_14065 [Saprospiraceae bacterium]